MRSLLVLSLVLITVSAWGERFRRGNSGVGPHVQVQSRAGGTRLNCQRDIRVIEKEKREAAFAAMKDEDQREEEKALVAAFKKYDGEITARRRGGSRPESIKGKMSTHLCTLAREHADYMAKQSLTYPDDNSANNAVTHDCWESVRLKELAANGAIYPNQDINGKEVKMPKEVVADSMPGVSIEQAAWECVTGWAGSPGHWADISRPVQSYCYSMSKGKNGRYFCHGIFANGV